MSKGTKQEYKRFNVDSIQNACLVMGMLISGVIVHLEKYKEYASEAKTLLENANSEYILAKNYDDINDKLLFRQYEILKLFADHQSSSFSYIDLRKLLKKKGYLMTPLSDDMTRVLNELLEIRNWTFHNPQSRMVAAKEIAEKNVPDKLKESVKIVPQLNPVIIEKVDKYELIILASLIIYVEKRIEQFEAIIKNMKSDYQEMYNCIEDKPLLMTSHGLSSKVQYIERTITRSLIGDQTDIAQISMAIQKSKYDGTEEAFKEWSVSLKK